VSVWTGPVAAENGCIGIPIPEQLICLAHANPETRRKYLASVKDHATLDLRGVPIDEQLMSDIHDALPVDEAGLTTISNSQFDHARFLGTADFARVRFTGFASFSHTEFLGAGVFFRARFQRVTFDDATFMSANFVQAEFSDWTYFRRNKFGSIDSAKGSGVFDKAKFSGDHTFFTGAEFYGLASFLSTTFSSRVMLFDSMNFFHDADFTRAQFLTRSEMTAVRVASRLTLDNAVFTAPTLIEVAARELTAVGCTWSEGATLRLRWADVVLDGSQFSKPSMLSYSAADTELGADLRFFNAQRLHAVNPRLSEASMALGVKGRIGVARPRLLSVRRVDVGCLAIYDLDLAACLFAGALNLDKLRIDGPLHFGLTPGAWRLRVGSWLVPIWRPWSRRITVAEEHVLRLGSRTRGPDGGWRRLLHPSWSSPEAESPRWLHQVAGAIDTPTPEIVASTYRGLRKGLEDQRNAPAAADFYYGEMEMCVRRPPPPGESGRTLVGHTGFDVDDAVKQLRKEEELDRGVENDEVARYALRHPQCLR
jgi:hypothetical protein